MTSENNGNKSMKLVLVAGILALGLLTATLAAGVPIWSKASAQEGSSTGGNASLVQGENPYQHLNTSTVSTTGTATSSVQPDQVSVTVGVETNGTTAEEAASANAELMEQVVAALTELGITEDQISTSNYNVYPVYEYKEPAEVCIMIYPPPPECQPRNEISGYRASNSVTVTLDVEANEGPNASQVIDAAVNAGANNINGVFFFISEEEQGEIRDSLIQEAIDNAKQRAEVAASALGYTVSGVKSIQVNDVYFPYFTGAMERSAVDSFATPLFPGEQDVSSSVTIEFYMTDIVA